MTSLAIDDRVVDRVARSPLFDPATYRAHNPDVAAAGVDPLVHYTAYGLRERRRGVTAERARALLTEIEARHAEESARYLAAFEAAQTTDARQAAALGFVGIYCHTGANYYMHPIAAALEHALTSAGARCRVLSEFDEPAGVECLLVVAPHEFFNTRLPIWLADPRTPRRAVMVNTEQLPSAWLLEALPWLYQSRGIVDLGFQSATIWAQAGIPSVHILPPFDDELLSRALGEFDRRHPLFESLDPMWLDCAGLAIPIADRPIDVFFAGHETPERSRFFDRLRPFLDRRTSLLAYGPLSAVGAPRTSDTRSLFALNVVIARLAKTVVALHRDPVGYFAWERMIVQGFSAGTAVAGWPCLPSPFFDRGAHYLEAPDPALDAALAQMLSSRDGLRRAQAMADAAAGAMTSITAERCGRMLVSFLTKLD